MTNSAKIKRRRDPPYRFVPSDPGIFVEVYLPKKPEFQQTLHEALANGFHIKRVRAHFEDRKKRTGIEKVLRPFFDKVPHINRLTLEELSKFPAVLRGYSLYDVDGTFYSSTKRRIETERTQVIRIMFRPDLKKLLKQHRGEKNRRTISSTARAYLRHPYSRREYRKELEVGSLQEKVVNYVERWSDYVGVFVFGFIVYSICERITELCAEGKMTWNKAEDEIWVTSFWNLVINPVKLSKSVTRRTKKK
jgi:hypothetical protein